MLGVIEGIGHGLVDRHRYRAGGRVGTVAAVHGQGFQLPLRAKRSLLLKAAGDDVHTAGYQVGRDSGSRHGPLLGFAAGRSFPGTEAQYACSPLAGHPPPAARRPRSCWWKTIAAWPSWSATICTNMASPYSTWPAATWPARRAASMHRNWWCWT
ncbi:hypothetical protein G6F46_014185 [Rhizopus delemar]|nr:hypothetical protein G6F46_014185 [Rhizopus delemar]